MDPRHHISGSRPDGYAAKECVVVRIPYGGAPEDHADVRRKLAAGWIVGEVYGSGDGAPFEFVCIYPPTPTAKPAD